ncbi:MAG: GxxExxY protein [bacterium]|nr:GxxExxY protein [bacterium]
MNELLHKEISYEVQGSFYTIYKTFGCSFKESIYHNALIEELKKRELIVDSQKRIDVFYNDKKVGTYIPDLVVNGAIIIEIKCKPTINKGDIKQFWHYLKGSEYKVGYLVNFGRPGGVEFERRVYDTARQPSFA